jgi:hypothetical protein
MPHLRLLWPAALPITAPYNTPQQKRCSDCPLYVQAGLDVGLQLIWVDYTSTQGTFPPGGEPPNFQAVRSTLQVRALLFLPQLDRVVNTTLGKQCCLRSCSCSPAAHAML